MMTPKKSRSPQALSQARNTGPRDIITEIRTRNSNAITHASKRCNAKTAGDLHWYSCARSIINAAEMEAAETTNSMPSSGVSDQIGRLVTASKTPVYPATKKAKNPPTAAMTEPTTPGGRNAPARGQSRRLSSVNPANKDRKLNMPNISSAHEPIDIGDH